MRTRIILGSILAILAAGILYADHFIGPQSPFLLVVSVLLVGMGTVELVRMIPEARRPRLALCVGSSIVLLLAHWLPLLPGSPIHDGMAFANQAFIAIVLLAFIDAMIVYQGPGEALNRVALTVFVVAYMGLLPGYFVELRLSQTDARIARLSLLLAIFVPKCCDIGAYFTGYFLGRHKMAPVLSPKKTWEGAAGGLATSAVTAIAIQSFGPVIPGGWLGAAAFGMAVGLCGMIGDLAESLIKRDCGSKDAGRALPEFGGVLDVVDAIVFAAPVVYWWLRCTTHLAN